MKEVSTQIKFYLITGLAIITSTMYYKRANVIRNYNIIIVQQQSDIIKTKHQIIYKNITAYLGEKCAESPPRPCGHWSLESFLLSKCGFKRCPGQRNWNFQLPHPADWTIGTWAWTTIKQMDHAKYNNNRQKKHNNGNLLNK